jgi:CheY-like chemotaxis protein
LADSRTLLGRRILVVEDDAMIAMMVEDMLLDLGCTVIGPAGGLEEAVRLAAGDRALDGALLDVNLNGQSVFPLADDLRTRGVPIVFCSGYGEGGLRDVDKASGFLRKPYRTGELAEALSAALL